VYASYYAPRRRGGGGFKKYCDPSLVCLSVRLSVPWRSCQGRAAALGYRHAGCLQPRGLHGDGDGGNHAESAGMDINVSGIPRDGCDNCVIPAGMGSRTEIQFQFNSVQYICCEQCHRKTLKVRSDF